MAISRILEASRIRVNSLGPDDADGAGGWFATGGFAMDPYCGCCETGYAGVAGTGGGTDQSGSLGAGAAGSVGVEREAKV